MAESSQSVHSLVSALYDKYSTESWENHSADIYVQARKHGQTASGDFVIPTCLSLDNYNVFSAGDIDSISRVLQPVTSLDLTKNHLTDWKEVFRIIAHMPKLSFLNLTRNALNGPITDTDMGLHTFPEVSVLVLNATGALWASVVKLQKIFPNLEELHLSLNNYKIIDIDSAHCPLCPSLKLLQFNTNCVCDWSELCKLGYAFPNLSSLVMGETRMVSFGAVELGEAFPNLKCLNISESLIADWREVDRINCFPSLKDIILHRIPLLQGYTPEKGRQLLIACLPRIERLNRSYISAEREDAERAFIRHYMDDEIKPERYPELELIHGKLDPLVNVSLKPKIFVKVKVKCDEREEIIEIDTRQTVAELKKLLQNFVGHPSSKFRLFYVDVEMLGSCAGHEELKFLNRKLHIMGVRDGDEFICHISQQIVKDPLNLWKY